MDSPESAKSRKAGFAKMERARNVESSTVNDAYVRWRTSGSLQAKQIVDIWTYYRVLSFFGPSSRRYGGVPACDRELLVDEALRRIGRSQNGLRKWNRYAAWVAIVCRNVHRSYSRNHRMVVVGEPRTNVYRTCTDPSRRLDRGQRLVAVMEAIDNLPPFLGVVMRLRFIDGLDYDEISRQTGKPIPTLRAYVSRGISCLRSDPSLAAYFTTAGPVRRA